MKKVIFLLVAAVILGGIALFGLIGLDSTDSKNISDSRGVVADTEETIETEFQTFVGEGSLIDVQNFGTDVECRISYDDPELLEPVIGTYFVSSSRVRGDFQMNVPELGGETVSSIIFKDEMFYSWSNINGELYGVKARAESSTEVDTNAIKEPVPSDARISYDCKEWKVVDGSIFEPPSEVLFQDVSNSLKSGMEYGTIYENGEF